MIHKHFTTIDSTQKYLKDNLENLLQKDPTILISTSEQTQGIGRNGHNWKGQSNALALSFSILPNKDVSVTPLELGILTIQFIKAQFNIQCYLKWPNDILGPHLQKCGGILTQYINPQTVIAGIGINLGKMENPVADESFKHGIESVVTSLNISDEENKEISLQFYDYLRTHRFQNTQQLQTAFEVVCGHMDSLVEIDDDQALVKGIFKGIGPYGEALVETDQGIKKFLSSSLKILSSN